jgi:AcrR family transcriptional regulator
MPRFQRARKPEEKEVRRRAILQAARDLAREVGPIELGLNELGRRSGVSKPNIYRYFESREEILFRLYVVELTDVIAASRRASVRPRHPRGRDHPRAGTLPPLLCQLGGMVASILEHNISADTIAAVKTELLSMIRGPWRRCADRFHGSRRPTPPSRSSPSSCSSPRSGPPPTLRAPRARCSPPEFAAMCADAGRDYPRFIEVLLAGLQAGIPATRGARR